MSPEYDKLAEMYNVKRDDIIIARLEGSINEDISVIYEIHSFPRIVMFYPGSVDIKSTFRGQRIAPVMDNWIEVNAPRLEKKLKILDKESEKQEKNVHDSDKNKEKIKEKVNGQVIKKYDLEEEVMKDKDNNKNNNKSVNEELDLIKIEMLNMKNKVINLEQDLEILKNHTYHLNSKLIEKENLKLDSVDKSKPNEENKNTDEKEEKLKKMKLIGHMKKSEGFFDKVTLLDFLIYFGIFSVLMGTAITLKKILFKKNKGLIISEHVKV